MRCRFPGASDVDSFWRILCSGTETITHFTEEELIAAGVPAERVANPNYVRAKGVIDGVEYFDHEFFGFSQLEAEVMDPQQRLFLQFAWQALESAGYDSAQFPGRIGLFAGQAFNTYLLNNLRHARQSHIGRFHGIDLLTMTDKDFLTTLAAHHLGLTGPAMTVQTACSTSVVAVHQACQALLNRECDVALAGAITVYSPQVKGYMYEPGNLISPDGHIRSFDAEGRGTVYSSGMGMLALKLLTDAIRDGDTVHAVIKGSAVNNDGGRKAVFKAPSEDGIAEAAATALAVSGVDPARIRMLEANGSGTENGDPIEVHALSRAFREFTDRAEYCAIGSVKSNVGHLNTAAGTAALLKAVLCVKNGKIVPTVNFSTPNPAIRFAGSPFRIADALQDWPAEEGPRLAAVNSYGVGGTNGHVIVAEPPSPAPADPARGRPLLVLSAKTPAALRRMRAEVVEFLSRDRGLPALADICYTFQIGRRQFPYRLAAVADDLAGLTAALRQAAIHGPVVPAGAPRWWFAAEFDAAAFEAADADADEATDPAWAGRLEEIRTAVKAAGHPRDLAEVLRQPVSGPELAVRTFCGQLAAVGALAPLVGIGGAAGRGVGALTAAVAVGALPAGEAVRRLLDAAADGAVDRTVDGEDLADPADTDVVVAGGGIALGRRPDGPAPDGGRADVLAGLWQRGVPVDWGSLYRGERRRRVPLPTYSFEPVRCWVDIPAAPVRHVYDAAL